jgi:hypothetical protein
MSIVINSPAIISSAWTSFKTVSLAKVLSIQYDDDGTVYSIFSFDDGELAYTCTIWKGAVPDTVIAGGYSQATNDSDKSDFETNYKPYANKPVYPPKFNDFSDPRLTHKFGQLTATSVSEVLLYPRTYAEPASQAQRSIVSTSATDSDALGTGARQIRITYLDSNYVLKTEDVLTNGLTGVNTVGTDIRFIENMEVIKGVAAVGAVKLMTGLAGAGTEIAGIGIATNQAFFCHHYVPAGKRAWIMGWGCVSDDETSLKLNSQDRFGTNTVDRILDLDKLFNGNLTPPSRIEFKRTLSGVMIPEKTYVRVTVVPNQATSTVMRGYIDFFEDVK